MTFAIYTSTVSANGRKVMLLIKHLGLNPELIEVDVYKGEGQDPTYKSLNPFGKVPTLVEGDFVLWESNAILQYIAEKHGNYQLTSTEPAYRADIARWMFWEAAHWQPTITTVLGATVGHALMPEIVPEPSSDPDWLNKDFVGLAHYLDGILNQTDYLCGDALSLADLSVAGMMTYFHFCKFPFETYPSLTRWFQRIEQLEAWQKTQSPLWS